MRVSSEYLIEPPTEHVPPKQLRIEGSLGKSRPVEQGEQQPLKKRKLPPRKHGSEGKHSQGQTQKTGRIDEKVSQRR